MEREDGHAPAASAAAGSVRGDPPEPRRYRLLYRLQRVREMTGRDMDDPDVRLALTLALRARILLGRADAPSGQAGVGYTNPSAGAR